MVVASAQLWLLVFVVTLVQSEVEAAGKDTDMYEALQVNQWPNKEAIRSKIKAPKTPPAPPLLPTVILSTFFLLSSLPSFLTLFSHCRFSAAKHHM